MVMMDATATMVVHRIARNFWNDIGSSSAQTPEHEQVVEVCAKGRS
jgi:hypothetical protein